MPDRAPVRFTVRHLGRSTIQEIEMTDAPERIWWNPAGHWSSHDDSAMRSSPSHEYIRADLAQPRPYVSPPGTMDVSEIIGAVEIGGEAYVPVVEHMDVLRRCRDLEVARPAPTLAEAMAVPEVAALVEAAKSVLHDQDHGNGLQGIWDRRDKLRAALAPFTAARGTGE